MEIILDIIDELGLPKTLGTLSVFANAYSQIQKEDEETLQLQIIKIIEELKLPKTNDTVLKIISILEQDLNKEIIAQFEGQV